MYSAAVIAVFCALLVLGFPVAASMLMASFAVLWWADLVPLTVVPTYLVGGLGGFELVAVPFFILAAELMNSGGITRRMFAAALMLFGRMPAALAQVTVVSQTVLAGISGSAVSDLAGLGRMQIRVMREAGYDLRFATGLVASCCLMGSMIPPSITLVIYAIAAEASVGKMLLAGLVPGLLLAAALMTYVWLLARRGGPGFARADLPGWRARLRVVAGALPALLSPVILLMGIAAGLFTPTEAAIVASLYCLAVATFFYREMTLAKLWRALRRTVLSTAVVMFLIAASNVVSWIITYDQGAMHAAQWFTALDQPLWLKLLLVNIFLLLVGIFLEPVPALLILVPILVPALASIGIDPVHFGIIMNFNLLLGILTPPVGIALFVAANITGMSVVQVSRAVAPFFLPLLAVLLLYTYVPWLSLALPRLVFP